MMGPMVGRVTFVSEAVSSGEGVTAGAGVTPRGGTLQVSSRRARQKSLELGPQRVHMVCAASVRVRACRLRVCVRQMLLRGRGHGGMWVCVSGSENVTCKF